MKQRHIVIVGYAGVMGLDLIGPLEVFGNARFRSSRGEGDHGYRVTTAAIQARTFRSEFGLTITADQCLSSTRDVDTLLIPGGCGLREAANQVRLTAWLQKNAASIRRIASVCTGIYGLAPSGLLNGRKVATHWRFAADVAKRFPKLRVEPGSLYVKDGKFWTAAGVTAGIDLSLALIEEDFGAEVALAIARELVVYMKRPGGQEQYSEPLQFQVRSRSLFADLVPWMTAHLEQDLSVEGLAARVSLCSRQFARRFSQEFGCSPASFVRRLRLDEARRRLSAPECTVDGVARSVGFSDAGSFRRAFERCFDIAPSAYRGRFTARLSRPG
ncbi:MAG TPA: helix-turn-helix domain-containing protein [Terracidiphilus sp.]|nr:helix-turn-helix domain-containing protein [Terracidiphilus sp.]